MFSCCRGKQYNRIPERSEEENAESRRQSRALKDKKKQGTKNQPRVIEILVSGSSECGKSTVCRQLVYLANGGIPEGDIHIIKADIVRNVVAGVKDLITGMTSIGIGFTADSSDAVERMTVIEPEPTVLTPQVVMDIKTLFSDEGARRALRRRNEFSFQESALYFIGKIDEIANPDYTPTWKDAVNVRKKTTEITAFNFSYKGYLFKLIDVSGEKFKRGEWIDYFEAVFLTIFVSSLPDFDVPMLESPSVNRMVDSMALFESISKNDCLTKKGLVLFLNKKDLFIKKLETKSISVLFPEYKGSQDYLESVKFIRDKFLQAAGRTDPSEIRAFVTTATDTTCMNKVFATIHDRMINLVSTVTLM